MLGTSALCSLSAGSLLAGFATLTEGLGVLGLIELGLVGSPALPLPLRGLVSLILHGL